MKNLIIFLVLVTVGATIFWFSRPKFYKPCKIQMMPVVLQDLNKTQMMPVQVGDCPQK